MKNSIILLIGVIGILCSCSEVDVTDYSSDNFIQFAKAAKDSTVFSFAYDQTMSAGTVKLKLNCIANLSTENRTFGVRYRAEESTAQAGVDFVMPDEEQVLLANDSVAYLEIQLNKSDNVKAKDLLKFWLRRPMVVPLYMVPAALVIPAGQPTENLLRTMRIRIFPMMEM